MRRFRGPRSSAAWWRLIASILAAACGIDTAQAQQAHRQVLVLHATRPDAQITAIAEAELPPALNAEFDGNLDYYSEFIDIARFPDAPPSPSSSARSIGDGDSTW
jgi:hypothetical protein